MMTRMEIEKALIFTQTTDSSYFNTLEEYDENVRDLMDTENIVKLVKKMGNQDDFYQVKLSAYNEEELKDILTPAFLEELNASDIRILNRKEEDRSVRVDKDVKETRFETVIIYSIIPDRILNRMKQKETENDSYDFDR